MSKRRPPHAADPTGTALTVRATDSRKLTITPAGCQLVEELVRDGTPLALVAATLGMSRMTLQRIVRDEPDGPVADAMARGRAGAQKELTGILTKIARNGEERNRMIAAMFLLKGAHNWRDSGPAPGESSAPSVAVQVVLPAAMSADDYRRTVVNVATPRLQATNDPATDPTDDEDTSR